MGEAKRRRQAADEALRQRFLHELDYLGAPELDGEVDLYHEVQAMPLLVIPRQVPEVIEWMRMKPGECHTNAYSFTQLDPSKRAKMFTGWWCDSAIPRLHSVVDQVGDGQLICITPPHEGAAVQA